MKRLLTCSIAMAAATLLCAATAAADPTSTEIAVGRKLFKEAVELENAQRWAEAAEKIRGAIAIKDTPGLRFHLARCEEEQGRLVEALIEYGRAEDLMRGGISAPDVVPLLKPARESLEQRVPSLKLILPGDVPSPGIEVNGVALAPSVAGEPAPLNPGRYRVVVRAFGRQPFERDVVLELGSRAEILVELPPERPAAAVVAEPKPSGPAVSGVDLAAPASRSSTRTVVLVAEVGFTVVGLGVGATFAFLRASAIDRVRAAQLAVDRNSNHDPGACSAPNPVAPESCGELASAVSDRDQATTLMTVGFVGAGVGAVATGLTWMFWPKGEDRARAARIEGAAVAGGGLLSVTGSF
jgi:hypothetical protein